MLPGRVTAAVAVLLCTAHAAPARELANRTPPAAWTTIATPIPRRELLAALDLDPGLSRALTLIEAVRRLHEDDTRRGTLRARLTALLVAAGALGSGPAGKKGRPNPRPAPADSVAGLQPDPDDDLVPLPLTEKFWESCITKPRSVRGSVASAIVRDPAVGLMYVALASTDPSTRVFLADQCELVSTITRSSAPAFSVVARSVRVRAGQVDTPGGPPALPLWQRLALPVNAPAQFLTRLVTSDAGRLAYFYDLIAQLEPARQRFALGLSEPTGPNTDIGVAVYRVCADSDPSWSVIDRPFGRMAVDVAFVLQQVRLTSDGRVASPATEAFLSAAFADGGIDRGRDDAAHLLDGPTVDAAMLVRLIMVSDWTRRRTRFLTLSFAQRVFPDLHPPDAPDALTALRAIAKVETLPFALERMGVRAPGVLAAAAQRALKFGLPVGGVVVVGADQQRADISAFQGSLALVERLVYARALQPAGATDLIQRLLDERTADPLGYSAHVAHWIGDDLLGSVGHARPAREPALNPAAATSGSAPSTESAGDNEREHRLLDAASGRTADPPTLLTWEGTRYRVDLAASEYTRMRAIRQRQGGPSLDDALDLIASARTLRSRGEGEDLSDVHATLERLVAHFGASESGEAEPAGVVDPLPELSAAVRALAGAQHPSVATRVQHARRLADLGATIMGNVLRSLVYACALGDAEGQAFLAGDVSRLHEFGLEELDASRRRIRTWELPVDVAAGGQPWHLTGSLLAVDLAMSRFALRRALGDMPSRQPTLSGPDRRALVATVALMNPAELSDTTRAALVGAMQHGREVLASALAADDHLGDTLARAGITGWRAQLLRWTHAFEPDAALRMVARSELVWLGVREPLPADVDAWGAPAQTIDGAWALRFPGPDAIDAVAGRQASAYLPGRFADLTLRVAELLMDLRLPSVLTREVLRAGLQRFIDDARPAYPDDWMALVRRANALGRADAEDYVYALTVTDGPLVPAATAVGQP